MFKLVHAGFDTVDIAFQGALPSEALITLEKARNESSERQSDALVSLGPGNVDMHVSGHGMRGGYAFITDTGPLGAKWMFKMNASPDQWNIFVSAKSTMLLTYGLDETRTRLLQTLADMGAVLNGHSINRVDFAMDFVTQNFELHLNQFVAHAHAKVRPHWSVKKSQSDQEQPTAVLRGRQLESVTIGKQPGRQIIVYNKRREALARQKMFWFKAWDIDPSDPSIEVWRVEIRAGKKELKDRWQIRRFEDLYAGIGDVCLHALSEVRYLADTQSDSNVTRQQLHPLWTESQRAVKKQLVGFRSGLLPGQVIEVERELALQRYTKLITSNAIGLGVTLGLSDSEIQNDLAKIVSSRVIAMLEDDEELVLKSIKRTRERLHFASRSTYR